MSTKLVLIRHGESAWNNENRFTGWYDADLSDSGFKEAQDAGQRLKKAKLSFDVAYTSVLKRAIKTLFYVQDALDLHWIPVQRTWRLNERMYGALTGLNKAETAAKHGDEQVKVWRRSYDVAPPPVDDKSEYYPANDPKYKDVDKKLLPKTECLKDTVARVLPFWNETIVPQIRGGKKVLVVAHGNSLRALVKYLSNLSDSEIMDFNIPTGIPIVYELDGNLKATKRYFLATDDEVKAAINKVEAQGKALPAKPDAKSGAKPASPTAKPDGKPPSLSKPDATPTGKPAAAASAPSAPAATSPAKPGPVAPAKPAAGRGK